MLIFFLKYILEKDILLIGINSVCGTIDEVANVSRKNNKYIDTLHIRQIYPVHKNIEEIINQYKSVYVVEHNYNGQLKNVLQSNLSLNTTINSILKYDGDIMYVHEILEILEKGGN